jgi:rare lipoprotein A
MKKLLFICLSVTMLIASLQSINAQKSFVEKGKAIQISDQLINKKTYSGEVYEARMLAASHLTLPFGTILVVKNTVNGKQTEVKVLHRGPFNSDAIVALSTKAIEVLALSENDEVEIKCTGKKQIDLSQKEEESVYYLLNSKQSNPKGYGVQLACYSNEKNILAIADSLQAKSEHNVFVQVYENGKIFYRLIIGDLQNKEQAAELANSLKGAYPDCFVVHFLDYE